MTFKEFWKTNRDRYEKLAETNVMLAINTAAEEAWELSNHSKPKQKHMERSENGKITKQPYRHWYHNV